MSRAERETAAAFGDAAAFGVTALTANFLDEGAPKVLAAPTVRPSDEAIAKAKAATATIAALRQKALANQTATLQAKYNAMRAREQKTDAQIHAWLLANDPVYAAREKSLSQARTDWGLLPAAAKLTALGVGIAVTGGALAGALAVPSVASLAGAAVAADRLIASAEKAGVAPSGAGQITRPAAAVLDAGQRAQGVINTTQRLADMGVPEAVAGARVLAETAAARVAAGTAPGALRALTASGSAAFDAYQAGSATPAVSAALASSAAARSPAPSSAPAPKPASSAPAPKPTSKPAAKPAAPVVTWFVSATGAVTAGRASGAGWLVFSDGRVVKQ